MDNIKKLTLKCPYCGKVFSCKAPEKPGVYSLTCPNGDCSKKVSFKIPVSSSSGASAPNPGAKKPPLGRLEDGSYRFKCGNPKCPQYVLVPAESIKIGVNKVLCPTCQTPHEFEIEPTEEDLLKCQASGCKGVLRKPQGGDGVYSTRCDDCGQEYSLIVQEGKVTKVILKTPAPIASTKQSKMKLVAGQFLGKREYNLTKGVHYIGRLDEEYPSDFQIKDKYASKKSLRVDVNEVGGDLVYKLTVERALNPVYHNNRELTVGDVVYLTYGDTLKLGKTLVKIQKIQK